MENRYRLHYAPDNSSLIVRLVLEELKLPFQTVLVDRSVQEHKEPRYLKLNPNGLIPVLETPDGPIFETGAILLWLADRHGALAPSPASVQRAAFLKWLFFVSNTLHTTLRMMFYPDQYVGPDQAAQTTLLSYMRGECTYHLDKLESLAATQVPWFAGTTPSLLDFYVVSLFRWLALYPEGSTGWFTISHWPRLHELAANMEMRESALTSARAEGLGASIFTSPVYADPPEGSAN